MSEETVDGCSPQVERLAIQLWILWRTCQDDTCNIDSWRRAIGVKSPTTLLAIAWADLGAHGREAWYLVAQKAIDVLVYQQISVDEDVS